MPDTPDQAKHIDEVKRRLAEVRVPMRFTEASLSSLGNAEWVRRTANFVKSPQWREYMAAGIGHVFVGEQKRFPFLLPIFARAVCIVGGTCLYLTTHELISAMDGQDASDKEFVDTALSVQSLVVEDIFLPDHMSWHTADEYGRIARFMVRRNQRNRANHFFSSVPPDEWSAYPERHRSVIGLHSVIISAGA